MEVGDISITSEYEVKNMYENKKKRLYNNIFKAFFALKKIDIIFLFYTTITLNSRKRQW